MANKAENVNAVIAGRYQLQGKLGQGGMGSAYRALDRVTGRVVALKQLDDPTPKFSALFEREYYTLASLRHPCVVEVYDFGITVASATGAAVASATSTPSGGGHPTRGPRPRDLTSQTRTRNAAGADGTAMVSALGINLAP